MQDDYKLIESEEDLRSSQSQDSTTSGTENATVTTEPSPAISFTGETIDLGDLSIRKEDAILVLLVILLISEVRQQ